MVQVIPAILAKNKDEFVDKVTAVFPSVDLIQIDIMDGRFVAGKTWGTSEEVSALHLPVDFEVHLMAENPEEVVEEWVRAGAQRVIFHIEATKNPGVAIEKIRASGREVGIAINPETPIAALSEWLHLIDYVLVMGVIPGASGRQFQRKILKKIRDIKAMRPGIKIGVDGGVNFETAKDIVAAGANAINAATAIFEQPDPEEAIKILQNI